MLHLKKILLFITIYLGASISTDAQTTLTIQNNTCDLVGLDITLATPGATTRCVQVGTDFYIAFTGTNTYTLPAGQFIESIHPIEMADPTNFTVSVLISPACTQNGTNPSSPFNTFFSCAGGGFAPVATLSFLGGQPYLYIQ